MTLPFDIARCPGTEAEVCRDCRRREPGDVIQWKIMPPVEFEGECKDKIERITTTKNGD